MYGVYARQFKITLKGCFNVFKARAEYYTINEFMGRKTADTGRKMAVRGKASKILLPLAMAPVVAGKKVFA